MRIIRKIVFWLVFVALLAGLLSYIPVLLRDPAKLPQNSGYAYATYFRNGFLPIPVYEWIIPGMTDFSAENSARYQFKCWILPLEKYQYFGDLYGGKRVWIRGYIETGIYYVSTVNNCIGDAQPKYLYKIYP